MRSASAGRVERALEADQESVHDQGGGQAEQLEGHEGVRPRVWIPDEGVSRRGGNESPAPMKILQPPAHTCRRVIRPGGISHTFHLGGVVSGAINVRL